VTNVLVEAGRLAAEGRPFALATVVDVERPASARRGDRALVTPDGALSGWVGGACTESTVVREGLAALADGEARVVRVEGGCASEGTIELLVEPQVPEPLLAVVGDGPAARTLAALAETLGWRVARELDERADAVIVASMGQGDENALQAALAGPAGYVGLVASAKRGAAVLADLRARGVDEESLARVRCPAGLDLGPSTQEEIAVAILAELVAWRHTRPDSPVDAVIAAPAEAVDPVCGMTVAVTPTAISLDFEEATYYFCCEGCRTSFEREPGRFLGARR
jgi:xanthine dehydrogenase accessory factor